MFHVKHEGWPEEPHLDSDQRDRLAEFERLLLEWSPRLGLVATGDLEDLHARHVLDCLRGATQVGAQDREVVDLGSGAGLPGLVVAVACPWASLTLAEARSKRAAFIELAIDRLEVKNARVHAGRVEELANSDVKFDLGLARAFAPPAGSWESAFPLLAEHGRLLYWAGTTFEAGAVPDSVRTELIVEHLDAVGNPALERFGPLVIMCRQ